MHTKVHLDRLPSLKTERDMLPVTNMITCNNCLGFQRYEQTWVDSDVEAFTKCFPFAKTATACINANTNVLIDNHCQVFKKFTSPGQKPRQSHYKVEWIG